MEEEIEYVKLVSAEGHEFIVDKKIATANSNTIRIMLEGSFREAREGVITFPDIAGYVLERVVKYLHYVYRHNNRTGQIPEFVSTVSRNGYLLRWASKLLAALLFHYLGH